MRKTLGMGWWRNASVLGRLALWMGIALLLVAPLPNVGGAVRSASASAAQPVRERRPTAGDMLRLQGRGRSPARAIAPQVATIPLSGHVVNQDGSPFTSAGSPNLAAGIFVMSSDGLYNFTYLANNGTFSIELEAGVYEVSVWLDSSVYSAIGAPASFYVDVSGAMDIGAITLINRDAMISGNVSVDVTPASGVQITAWGAQGEQFSTTTINGHYDLAVTPGEWQVAPDLLNNTSFIYAGSTVIRYVDAANPATIDFSVEQASGTITGAITNQTTATTAADIVGWAYVRRNNGDVLRWAPIDNGTFSMPAPSINSSSDVLYVGLYIDPSSNYSSFSEVAIDNSQAPNFVVNMPVQVQDATISGHVYLASDASHAAVPNVSGQVVLTQLNDSGGVPITKSAPIDLATGSYSAAVPSGDWLVTYQILTDAYQADLSTPMAVTVGPHGTAPLDLPLTPLDGFVTAVVRDQKGDPQPNVTVWVRYGTQEVYAETDSEGKVTVYVPYSTSGVAAGVISPQGQQQPPLKIGTSYSSCNKSSKIDKSSSSSGKCKNNSQALTKKPEPKTTPRSLLATASQPSVELDLRDSNSTLAGRVLVGTTPRAGAFISAWNSNGQWISGFADATGSFSLPIVQDSTISTIWQISASYWDSSARKLLSKLVSVNVPAGHDPATPIAAGDLALDLSPATPPASESQHFDKSDGLTLLLSDGTLIQIPPDAIPDDPVSKIGNDIRITVEPQNQLPSTDLNRLANFYGYTINLYDANTNKPIDQLKRAATITFSYTAAQLEQLKINEADLQPAQFANDTWHVADGYLQDTQGDVKTISLETKTLDGWALVVEQSVKTQAVDGFVYLPLVIR